MKEHSKLLIETVNKKVNTIIQEYGKAIQINKMNDLNPNKVLN